MRTDYFPLVARTNDPPPEDAVEVYLPAPLSYSLAVDAMTPQSAMQEEALQIHVFSGQRALRDLQTLMSGHSSWPQIRLYLAVETHAEVPSSSILRLHHHIYVGAMVADHENRQPYGRHHPLNREYLAQVQDNLYGGHTRFLRERSTAMLGFQWKQGEIVEPPFARFIDDHPVTRDAVCSGAHGTWGADRVRIFADDEEQRFRAEQAARRRAG